MAPRQMTSLRSVFSASVVAAFMFMLAGCADDPSSVGSFLLPRSDLVGVDSVIIISGETYGEKAVPFSFTAIRSTLAVGKSESFEA